MNMSEQDFREIGLKIAQEAGAKETAKIIQTAGSSYKNILETAYEEMGEEKLAGILQDAPALFTHMASVRSVNLGKAGYSLMAALAPTPAKPGDAIKAFQLYQGAAVSGIARVNETGDRRFLNQGSTYDFIPGELGLAKGTVLRFYFGIEDDALIKLAAAPETFVYDPGSDKIAYYASWGCAGTQHFALENHPGSN